MRKQEFDSWLAFVYVSASGSQLNQTTCRSRVSNCQTVENHEGDLDSHFQADKLDSLLERLVYSKDDQRRNSPPRHSVPIEGNIYNGTATLRTAIGLYLQFSVAWPIGSPAPKHVHSASAHKLVRKPAIRKSPWPDWHLPDDEVVLELAKMTTKFIRFLHPDIVQAIVEDNATHSAKWTGGLIENGINPDAYLWPGSACAFPGIRRYAGSKEIAEYRGHGNDASTKSFEAIRLDDNDFPKQIWSIIFTGKKFAKRGPSGYALAHLADHKQHKNRFEKDFRVNQIAGQSSDLLFGLYTSPANTVFVPNNLIKPTDFAGAFRNLLMRKAESLYGQHCNLLPPWLSIPAETGASTWSLGEFEWSKPVGTKTNLPKFLEFRLQTMTQLLKPEH